LVSCPHSGQFNFFPSIMTDSGNALPHCRQSYLAFLLIVFSTRLNVAILPKNQRIPLVHPYGPGLKADLKPGGHPPPILPPAFNTLNLSRSFKLFAKISQTLEIRRGEYRFWVRVVGADPSSRQIQWRPLFSARGFFVGSKPRLRRAVELTIE